MGYVAYISRMLIEELFQTKYFPIKHLVINWSMQIILTCIFYKKNIKQVYDSNEIYKHVICSYRVLFDVVFLIVRNIVSDYRRLRFQLQCSR